MRSLKFAGPPLTEVTAQLFRRIQHTQNALVISTALGEYRFCSVRAHAITRKFIDEDISLNKAAELVGATDLKLASDTAPECNGTILPDNTDVDPNWMRIETADSNAHHPEKSLQAIREVKGGIVIKFAQHAYWLKMEDADIDSLRAALLAPCAKLPLHITSRPEPDYWRPPAMPRLHVKDISLIKTGTASIMTKSSILIDFSSDPTRKAYQDAPTSPPNPVYSIHHRAPDFR